MGFPPGGGGGGPWGYAGGPSGFATVMPAAFGPAGQAVMSEREVRLQKRKQANRDSARRSKQRKKAENEAMVVHSVELKEQHTTLMHQLSAAKDKLAQLQTQSSKLRSQLFEMGIQLPC